MLTRALKEAWVFGKLDTVGVSRAEEASDQHAREVIVEIKRYTEGTSRGGGVET